MALPEVHQVLVLLINISGAFLAVAVYRREPKATVNRIFLGTIVLMLVWVNFAYAAREIGVENPDLALVLLRIAWTATPLFVASLYFLVVYLTRCQGNYQRLHWAVATLAFAATVLAGLTGLVVIGIRFVDHSVAIEYGHGMWPYLGILSLIVFATALVFYRSYFALPPQNRLQLQYVGVGLLIFYTANVVFNIAFPMFLDVVQWYWLGDYSTLAVLGLTGYAIIRKQLFEIRLVLATLLVAFIAFVLVVDLIVFTGPVHMRIVKGGFLLVFLYAGLLLVRSVHREIDQREKLEEITAELRRADEAKTEFISIVSHQLRTPLNAIQGYLSLFLEGAYGPLDGQKRKPIERLHRSGQRLIHLVNDLLGVSRIQMGKIDLELGAVDLCKVARSIVEELSWEAQEKGIVLRATCSEAGVPSVTGDLSKLRDSIMNLVDNAIRYTDKGSVEVSVVSEGNDILVRVADTGAGIDPAEAKALFKSFRRGDVGRKKWVEGSGLGLYIAQQFIALHRGKIWAESKGKGQGSTFHIRIPVRRLDRAA
jgi:signal transduction histidine kinase